jgi:hypothetical protein
LHGGHGLVRALVRDHLDDLSVAEGGDVGPEMRVVLAGPGRAHDHDHLVAGVDDVDELADASTTPRLLGRRLPPATSASWPCCSSAAVEYRASRKRRGKSHDRIW